MQRHNTPRRKAALISLAAILVTVIAACGGGDDPTTTVAADPGSDSVVVDVSLTDTEDAMQLTPSVASVAAGTITFSVTNDGTREHEFVVLKFDPPGADLPFDEAADEVLEEGDGVTAIDELPSIQVGETLELTVDLDAGHYALICNFERHYRAGMWSDFDVTG
jgi:uncharacterized cupredoxin-like copper-binding protein